MSAMMRNALMRYRVPHLFALLALFLSLNAAAAGLDARLDRTRVAEGETVALTLTASGDAKGAPDPAPLQNDFDLLNQSQSTRMSIVNGHSSSTREWQWVLAPKRTGKLRIPPLSLDGNVSVGLDLEVLPAAKAAELGEARPLIIEVEAQPEQPYVQSQVIYTVRILSRVSLRQASLSDPQANDAIIERLGEDKQGKIYRDGQQYQIIERRYAVFPQHSGKLEISAPVLSAQIPEQGRRAGSMRDRMLGRDPFAGMNSFFGADPFSDMGSLFARTRPVQLRGQALDLQVQPQPGDAVSPWLPAQSLSLAESWSPDPPQFRVGEPVTRSLAITAQGLTAAQLPELSLPAPAGVKVYPDKTQSETQPRGDTLVAQKILKSAWVPSQAGPLTLPEVRLAWWDTRTGKPQIARLPARTVEVSPAAAGVAASPPLTAPSTGPVGKTLQTPETAAAPPRLDSEHGGDTSKLADLGERAMRSFGLAAGYWPWIALVLALAWLFSTLLWLRARARGHGETVAGAGEPAGAARLPDSAEALAAVKKACRANDARSARQALLDWAAARWPETPPARFDTLAQRLSGDAAEALRELDRVLYAGAQRAWDGAAAWRRLEPSLRRDSRAPARAAREAELPPLYPQSI